MSSPATPNGSQQDLADEQPQAPPVFHNFLRAFYPFHPSYSVSDSSVTLPLSEGDVILVHSIHTNGWADGTLLLTGARGWLPTNYCEAYDPEEMRNLLKALLNFWDLLRSTSVNDSEIFGNQEFMKGIIAGVRCLLERTDCLTRESAIIQRHEGLRRGRKSLLSELSSLVKTAKRLQETQRGMLHSAEDVNDIVDEMILKAFRIVTKGVRFLDVLEEDRSLRAPAAVTVMDTVVEESHVPPTPPADLMGFEEQSNASDVSSRADASQASSDLVLPCMSDVAHAANAPVNKRLSSITTMSASPTSHRLSQNINRLSGISHRVSLAGPPPLSRPQHLVSERLNKSHDAFLSHLGSFIGRLHLQSQSRPELAFAIKLTATSGGDLLAVIDVVCSNTSSSDMLPRARDSMFDRIQDLVSSAGQIIHDAASQEEDVIMQQDNGVLLLAATGCVKAAGECVAKTKWVIERVGDFECEVESGSLGIDLSVLDVPFERRPSVATSVAGSTASQATSVAGSCRTVESCSSGVQRLRTSSTDKPLPELPQVTSPVVDETPDLPPQQESPPNTRPSSLLHDESLSSTVSSVSSLRPTLPPLPKLSTSLLPGEDYSPVEKANQDTDFQSSFQSEPGTVSSAGSSATYHSRDSESSLVSQTSTRATTPDHTMGPKNKPSMSELSNGGSSTQAEEVDDVECKLLEKTYAYELMFNKEGQVTGGSIPALVERLTTHESTPDATFVSTFYLTFRLFCTPVQLAEALIDRFDYVVESPHMAAPVRLRVYNAFKGWLETHWRDETDREALDLIEPFAEHKLSSALPSAGRRLLELAQRVSSEGSLVPRNVSSMGKTNTSIAQYVPAETPHPAVSLSRSQVNALQGWKNGGTMPSVLDFEPLELARQLTVKQMTIFCAILPEELLASEWMKKGGVGAPNVKAMTAFSTDLSNLVAETILQHSEVKKRATVIKQWIKIAHQCFELHNYDGLMAIICSLNSSTISRLRKTWDMVSPKRRDMLRQLQAVVEPSQNNKVLRGRLHDHVPPCLPFLGMYLTDLTFVDIGNPATKQLQSAGCGDGAEENGAGGRTVVNFDKHTRTAKIIGELQRFQIPYRLTEVPELQEWLEAQVVGVRDGDQGNVQVSYYRKSLLLEPREAAPRTPIEGPSGGSGQRTGDLFGWMTRDRGIAPVMV
ncbi:RasGEF domain-containing protein [Sodiomyces alkalinus F11]|uniref:RasGEF domain-containing protein n=1 Tax=Sodiomyces alkalinus (strain CBS 110278 / VKM F-3762 / F11) TaxID=1314773 RepID=A0A3N2Q132_SODAK|nr:RasGEF domain-containing protein [Sodiomyces alkalinus F11]ROT40469.1 RasGEF domain-containing protein [Sodiomyces alkalinus F11]